jgi:hypothetical protein
MIEKKTQPKGPYGGMRTKGKERAGPFKDILETARVLSLSTVPEKVIETVLSHLCDRLGKRARCALLEGADLRLRYWAGQHTCPIDGVKINKNSIVWDVVKKGIPVNLTRPEQTERYTASLSEPVRIKAIIPLGYTDPFTEERKEFGVIVVDSGREEVPISNEDFEYLQVIAELISAIVGRAQLIDQLMASWSRQEEILKKTAHNFRNSLAVIGGFAHRIARLTEKNTELAEKAKHLFEEVKEMEGHVADFEKYMSLPTDLK